MSLLTVVFNVRKLNFFVVEKAFYFVLKFGYI